MTGYPGSFGPLDHLWLAALYATFVLLAFTRTLPFLDRVLGAQALVKLGELSYGIYMFHQPISGLLHGIVEGRAPIILSLYDAAVTLAALVPRWPPEMPHLWWCQNASSNAVNRRRSAPS